jgi:6-phosphogluconolactonase
MSVQEFFAEDREDLFERLTSVLFEKIRGNTNEHIVLGICGGRSIVGVLKAMAARRDELEVSHWKKLQIFMVDERVVPLDHEESNFRLVRANFLNDAIESGLLSESQLHPFEADASTAEAKAAEYGALLDSFGGSFDVVFLGVGEDGHVAALFPDAAWTASDESHYLTMTESPKPPANRMSASKDLITRSDLVVALFLGDGKRDALRCYLDSAITESQCPVKMIKSAREAIVLRDIE